MKLIAFKIKPKSNFATIPKGDTIFGQIVSFSYKMGYNLFDNYLTKPNLIVSDMMPFGYLYRPTLLSNCFKIDDKEIEKKELRKKRFISLEDLQNGKLYKCENVDFYDEVLTVKNSINRDVFSTTKEDFFPYSLIEYSFKNYLWMFILVEKDIETKVINIIKKISHIGFGKKATIGKGFFDIEEIENPIKDFDTDYHMSISPTILKSYDKAYYDVFVRFGKFGLDRSVENAFKKPVILADSGAIIKSKLKDKYFGDAIDNGYKDKNSFLQGYSIAIPIKDIPCLK